MLLAVTPMPDFFLEEFDTYHSQAAEAAPSTPEPAKTEAASSGGNVEKVSVEFSDEYRNIICSDTKLYFIHAFKSSFFFVGVFRN